MVYLEKDDNDEDEVDSEAAEEQEQKQEQQQGQEEEEEEEGKEHDDSNHDYLNNHAVLYLFIRLYPAYVRGVCKHGMDRKEALCRSHLDMTGSDRGTAYIMQAEKDTMALLHRNLNHQKPTMPALQPSLVNFTYFMLHNPEVSPSIQPATVQNITANSC